MKPIFLNKAAAQFFGRLIHSRNRRCVQPGRRPLRLEPLEDRKLLTGIPASVYFEASVETSACANIITTAGCDSAETKGMSGTPEHRGETLNATYTVNASADAFVEGASAFVGGASASAEASASIQVGKVSSSGGATARGSDTASAVAQAEMVAGMFLDAELGSSYEISLDISEDIRGIDPFLQGTIPAAGYAPGEVRSWWIVEPPTEEAPPKLVYAAGPFFGAGTDPVGSPVFGETNSRSYQGASVTVLTAEHTPPPPGDIVARSAKVECPDVSCFEFTYRIDDHPVPPFHVGLYASNTDSEPVQLWTGNSRELQSGVINTWVTAPSLRTVGEHTVRVDLPESMPEALHLLLSQDTTSVFIAADDRGNVAETNEENNIAFVPDLRILDATTTDNQHIEIHYAILNAFEDGEVDLEGLEHLAPVSSFDVHIYLSSVELLDSTQDPVATERIEQPENLEFGGHKVTIDLGERFVKDESRFLIVELDIDNEVGELDKSNNMTFVKPLVPFNWKVNRKGHILEKFPEQNKDASGQFQQAIDQEIALQLEELEGSADGPRLVNLRNAGGWKPTTDPTNDLDLRFANFVPDIGELTMPSVARATNRLVELLGLDVPHVTSQLVELLDLDLELPRWKDGLINITSGYRPPPGDDSLHQEARAVDIQPGTNLDDGRKGKEGSRLAESRLAQARLAGLAWLAGFDWVFHEQEGSRPHVHVSSRRSFDTNGLRLQLNSPAELLVVSTEGEWSGFIPAMGVGFDEIPLSTVSGPADTHPQTFSTIDADSGTYFVYVFGTGTGSFTLDVAATDVSGNQSKIQKVEDTSPGTVTAYAVRYSAATTSNFSVEVTFPHHNPRIAADANDDGEVTPQDVVLIASSLLRDGSRVLEPPKTGVDQLQLFLDPSPDHIISPRDILVIVQHLLFRQGGGEGEALPTAPTMPPATAFAAIPTLTPHWNQVESHTRKFEPLRADMDSKHAQAAERDAVYQQLTHPDDNHRELYGKRNPGGFTRRPLLSSAERKSEEEPWTLDDLLDVLFSDKRK